MTVRGYTPRQNPAYRPGDPRALAAGLLLLAVACTHPVPRQPVTGVVPVTIPSPPAVAGRLVLLRSPVAREYVVGQRARITITSDSGMAQDSFSLVLEASVRRVTDGGFAGLVRSIVLSRQDSSPVPVPGVVTPFAFSSAPVARGVAPAPVSRAGDGDVCRASGHVPLAVLRDLLFEIPDTLSVGMVWTDSGRYNVCRDGVHLRIESRRLFRVSALPADPDQARVIVDRESSVSMVGERVRGEDTTRVNGTGAGTARYTVSLRGGGVQAATGTARLSLFIQGGTRREQAEQISTLRISLREP